MERVGYVSLWIGNVLSDEMLEEYLEIDYSTSGIWQLSNFLKDFKIGLDDYDEDFVERIFYEEQKMNVCDLLEGCSYEDTVVSLFNEMVNQEENKMINAAILLYNFEYKGDVKVCERENCKFEFVGSVKYE